MRISDWSSDVCSSDLGGDPDEPRDPRRPVALDERERGEQHKPSAHRRSDEDHRPLGLRVDQVEYIAAPVEQGLIGEQPARQPASGIIETQAGTTTGNRPIEPIRTASCRTRVWRYV